MKALRNPYVMTEGQALKHSADVLLEITKLDTKAGVVESGTTISGAVQQIGHKVRIKVKKNRLGVPARMAQFTWHYDLGIIDTDVEIFELAKSLGIIFHPINPETGKANVQSWQFASYDPIRGEANMLAFVKASKDLQQEILQACYKYKDAVVTIDTDGIATTDSTTTQKYLDDLEIEL